MNDESNDDPVPIKDNPYSQEQSLLDQTLTEEQIQEILRTPRESFRKRKSVRKSLYFAGGKLLI